MNKHFARESPDKPKADILHFDMGDRQVLLTLLVFLSFELLFLCQTCTG
jgi:hypothetical protein